MTPAYPATRLRRPRATAWSQRAQGNQGSRPAKPAGTADVLGEIGSKIDNAAAGLQPVAGMFQPCAAIGAKPAGPLAQTGKRVRQQGGDWQGGDRQGKAWRDRRSCAHDANRARACKIARAVHAVAPLIATSRAKRGPWQKSLHVQG